MAENILANLANAWNGLRSKTAATVCAKEIAYVRGKPASRTVLDNSGNIIVEEGQPVTEVAIQIAMHNGSLHDLAAAVAEAKVQGIAEHARRSVGGRPAVGVKRDEASLSDEARRCVGLFAGMDVRDSRGSVMIAQGRRISFEDVVTAREAGQLSALIHAAYYQPAEDSAEVEAESGEEAGNTSEATMWRAAGPSTSAPPKPGRTSRPLGESYLDSGAEEHAAGERS